MELEEISLDTPVAEVGPNLLVETDGGNVLITHAPGAPGEDLHAHFFDGRDLELKGLPRDQPIGQACGTLTSLRPIRIFHLPPGEVAGRSNTKKVLLTAVPMVLGVALIILGLVFDITLLRLALFVLGSLGIMLGKNLHDSGMGYKRWGYTVEGHRTPIAELELPPRREQANVNDVKEQYGALLSDIAYRIECPALFDPHEPTTKAFTLALLQWDNNDGVVDEEERRKLAIKIRATFEAAKANAERIGMAHLPADARPKAETALKAARLAADEQAPQAERDAALHHAVELLDALALYYLPTGAQARKAITGGALLQLPGRRS